MERITVVIPCYNEQEVLTVYYKEMKKIMMQMESVEFELIFVDDGSTDGTLRRLKLLHHIDCRCKYISFSRNFGKEAAMYAGLQKADGDYVVVMDVDLQDPPSYIPEMYKILLEGEYDAVATRRVDRNGEKRIRSLFSSLFYKIMNRFGKVPIVEGARDFRMMKRKMVNALLSLGEYNRFSKGMFNWVGFRTKWLSYHNVERAAGETKWSFFQLVKYSFDGIIGFSNAPLSFISYTGVFFCVLSLFSIILMLFRHFIWHVSIIGWAVILWGIVFIAGIELLGMGILGQYVARTYMEVKGRPIYILRESSEERDEVVGKSKKDA